MAYMWQVYLWSIKNLFPLQIVYTKSLKIQRGKSKKNRQHNGEEKTGKVKNNDLQNIIETTKDRATHAWLVALHVAPPCYSCKNKRDKPWIRKEPDCDYDKRNIPLIICDTDTP